MYHTKPFAEEKPISKAYPVIQVVGTPGEGFGPNGKGWFRLTAFGSHEPISKAYPVIDNDLARDNLENDLTAADIQDLQ